MHNYMYPAVLSEFPVFNLYKEIIMPKEVDFFIKMIENETEEHFKRLEKESQKQAVEFIAILDSCYYRYIDLEKFGPLDALAANYKKYVKKEFNPEVDSEKDCQFRAEELIELFESEIRFRKSQCDLIAIDFEKASTDFALEPELYLKTYRLMKNKDYEEKRIHWWVEVFITSLRYVGLKKGFNNLTTHIKYDPWTKSKPELLKFQLEH